MRVNTGVVRGIERCMWATSGQWRVEEEFIEEKDDTSMMREL